MSEPAATTMPSVSAALAEFVSADHALAPALVDGATMHIVDTAGCMLSGSRRDSFRLLARLGAIAGAPVTAYDGAGPLAGAPLDALLAGVAAHADDFDDTSEASMNGHPSAPVVAALMAGACQIPISGARFVEAYAAGVEVACKLGLALGPAHSERGWHTISTLGTIGAAAACARLLELDRDRSETALAIAASLSGGLLGNTGTMVKPLHAGHAAWSGTLAALLARHGYDAGREIFERPSGFADLFAGHGADAPPLRLPALGDPWDLLDPGIDIKRYPSCACTHPLIDAALAAREPGLALGQIAAIRCRIDPECERYLAFAVPQSPIEGKFSAHYCVACALVRGRVGLTDFTDAAIAAADIAAVMATVEVIGDGTREATCLEIDFRDGRREVHRPHAPRVGWSEVESKFVDCAAAALAGGPALELLASLRALQELDTVAPVARAVLAACRASAADPTSHLTGKRGQAGWED